MARTPRTQKALIELYRVAVDEYRFEVRLNWDRMQYYAVVNSGIIAVGTSLLRDAVSPAIILLSGVMFLVGLAMSIMGIVSTHKGREYYQETVLKKTIYEEILGLNNPVPGITHPRATLAIGTTSGHQDVAKILSGQTPQTFFQRLIRNRIISYFIWLLIFLALIDIAGVGYTVWRVSELSRAPAVSLTPTSGMTVYGPSTIILDSNSRDVPSAVDGKKQQPGHQPH